MAYDWLRPSRRSRPAGLLALMPGVVSPTPSPVIVARDPGLVPAGPMVATDAVGLAVRNQFAAQAGNVRAIEAQQPCLAGRYMDPIRGPVVGIRV